MQTRSIADGGTSSKTLSPAQVTLWFEQRLVISVFFQLTRYYLQKTSCQKKHATRMFQG